MGRPPRPETRQYNGKFRSRIASLPWIERGYVMAEHKPCAACAAVAHEYLAQELPELPVPGCLKSKGCTCWFVALLPATTRQ